MFSVMKNGELIAIVQADDVKFDLTGDQPVMIFVRDNGDQATVEMGEETKKSLTELVFEEPEPSI